MVQYLYQPDVFWAVFNYVKTNPWEVLIGIISVIYFIKLAIFILRWWYAEKRSKDYVYMKVILPKDDSKLDTEKKTEKDFKEKVGIMGQLYRALSEISELNLKNTLRTMIFLNDQVSFEILVQDNELNFFIVCHPYFHKIVEKQITTFYSSAEVVVEQPYSLKQKGFHMR